MDPTHDVSHPVVKAVSAIVIGGGVPWYTTVEGWTQAATLISIILAAFYSLLLIFDWWWKKFWRPLAERKGWVKKRRQRIITVEEYETENAALTTGKGPL